MSSFTSDFIGITKVNPINNSVEQRNALSTIKRTRQCQRRKILNIVPLKLDQIQKEIEEAEADTQRTWELLKNSDDEKEDKRKASPKLQDSFDLNFSRLTIETPAKQPAKNEKFVTPCPQQRPPNVSKTNRTLDFQYTTPNNKIPPKVQCSVNIKPLIQTPISKLYVAPTESRNHCDPQAVQLPLINEVDFNRIFVNEEEYVVLHELGKGGSSEVFCCFNPKANALRAIKVVSLHNPASASGFINEVKMLKALQTCSRIIKMFDFEIKKEEKTLLVVLEMGGSDLSKILKESALETAHIPLYMLLYYWMEMLYAVKQMHSHGIIHSDLKPANFLKVEGYLKLIDFGIASCIQNDMTSVIKTVPEGSFNYVSPEALSNDSSSNENSPTYGKQKFKISYKSDVWSLGCILYQMVYRRTPFQHIANVWTKLITIANPNHQINYPDAEWVPEKVINTMKNCLRFNMRTRPSVDELISEYEDMFKTLS